MPSNVELKARARDFARQHALARALAGGAAAERIEQLDVFFRCPQGRLKLRYLAADRGELIYYERADDAGPSLSRYVIAPTGAPSELECALTMAYGVAGRVKKTRHLYLAGQTRIHLDEVEGLGQFLELEVVLGEGQGAGDGEAVATSIASALGIAPEDRVDVAYVDLLAARAPGAQK
ncbi:MAG TPA: class IV adenylate cyclase [Polyangiaceae bacterium]|nr:class IV adenylate cyclase [Polyangiaceae bacterium]